MKKIDLIFFFMNNHKINFGGCTALYIGIIRPTQSIMTYIL